MEQRMQMEQSADKAQNRLVIKKAYARPSLVVYGSITKLTQNANGSGSDGGPMAGMTMV